MAQETVHTSLTETTRSSIGNFLYEEGFERCEITPWGILKIINLISDYHEEGIALYPEVIITNDFGFFKSIPNHEIIIKESFLEISEFKNVIKLCAPLAIGNWIIFIEIKNGKIKYGLINAEMSETSPSIYQQTVGDMSVKMENTTVAYIRNVGSKTVELVGLKKRLIVSLTLDDILEVSNDDILNISNEICKNCSNDFRIPITTFLNKTINQAVKNGHGNLIGIVEDNLEKITSIKKIISDGIYLDSPIDIADFVVFTERERTNESSVSLNAHSDVVKAMLNHDGITIITNTAKVIAYHVFIQNILEEKLVGGARTRAFQSMVNSSVFEACFYKSQDGNSKTWKKNG